MEKKWIVYMHTNVANKKSYVGITCRSPKRRWTEHTHSAKSGSPFHFHNAIRLYGTEGWKHTVLEKGIKTLREAELIEISYILRYDTFESGYNSTIGGEGEHRKRSGDIADENYNRRKKPFDSKKDYSVYEFSHPDYGKELCTRSYLIKKYNLQRSGVHKLVRGERKHSKGWTLQPKT